ncbi:unnamed protein product [Brachionus calyciflorus]|uniref:DNA 5'-3' helicase n=1 Tax=Brachionus calyciflorus TaxID=104777 RepID=A0A813MKE7_9BILA|nr:unnamed protein product [Brachionus calyciflorus]
MTSNCKNYSDTISIPENFPFPYEKPYEIQINFMKALYKTLELSKIGIFESPTGTGKSLSLICGSMKWLRDMKEKQKADLEKLIADEEEEKKKKALNPSSGFSWLTEHEENFEKNLQNMALRDSLDKQVKQEKEFNEMKNRAKTRSKQKINNQNKAVLQAKNGQEEKRNDSKDENFKDELDLILDDYKSDEEDFKDFDDDDDDNKEDQLTRIFFCSRTHSQISQFIGELKKTIYSDSARVVSLGSRMNLCINDTVLKLGSFQAVNDRCLELQKNKKSTNKSGSKKSKIDSGTKEPYDIEDFGKAGREEKICSYYGARYSIPSAEIIALPYNILFQKETRESFSINLKNQVVIIDEAHNLIDTIAQIHSVEFTDQHVYQSLTQLNNYVNRYKSRFSAKNMLYLRQLINVLTGLQKIFTTKDENAKLENSNGKISFKLSKMWTVVEFMTITKFFNLNFVKLLKFCEETQLEKKLIGFNEKFYPKVDVENEENKGVVKVKKECKNSTENSSSENQPMIKSPIMLIKQFMKALSSPLYDGRIILTIDPTTRSTLKYMLLNPNICFDEIVSQAKSVILAGGTMKPVSDFEQLIKEKERIEYFSCGHVIPKDNIACLGLSTGPTGIKFDFSYNSRDNNQILDELGRQLIKLCSIVPSGLVVFFVSYDYLDKVVNHFKKNSYLDKLNEKKTVFYEPRLSSECDRVFNEYIKAIKKPKPNSRQDGAILFAVVGGKMSEGINFSDELGRCVCVVGQPFANIKSLELQEKMQYLNKTQERGPNDKLPGQIYYENICWKAINQSIGRAIRHQNDYATIVLIDARYCNQSLFALKEKLPQWIGDSFKQESFTYDNSKIMEDLVKFYAAKSKK